MVKITIKAGTTTPLLFHCNFNIRKVFKKIFKLCLTIGVHLYYTIVKLKVRTKGDEKYEQQRY